VLLKKLVKKIREVLPDANLIGPTDSQFTGDRPLLEEEKQFLDQLRLEQRKVEEFYFSQLAEAAKKKNVLDVQLIQLGKCAQGKCIYVPPKRRSFLSKQVSTHATCIPPEKHVPASLLRKRSISWTHGENSINSDSKDALSDQSMLRFQLKKSVSSLLTQNSPEIARSQVKKAIVELYRSLELLNIFHELNVTTHMKIVNKFQKYSHRNLKDIKFREALSDKFFVSTELTELINGTEELFCVHFTDGNRPRAKKFLRTVNSSRESTLYPVYLSGICTGLNIMLIYSIIRYMTFLDSTAVDNKSSLALIYFGLGFPIIIANLFAVNMHIWDVFRVNYRLIFGVKPTASSTTYFAFVSLLGTIYLMLVSLSLSGSYDGVVSASGQVWITIGVVLFLFFNNLDFYDPGAKKWLTNVLSRIVVSPSYTCRFKDFFIADQLVSIAPFYQSFGLLVDLSIHPSHVSPSFSYPAVWYIAILPILPFLFRCLQSLRRYSDGLGLIQLYNFLRYCLGIVVLLLIGFQTMYKEKKFLIYMILAFRLLYSLISLYWDISLDWGLGKGRMNSTSKEKQIMIAYPRWTYYAVIVFDALARFIWLPFLLFQIYEFHASYGSYILGIIEILRRFVWNFVRVEIEHVHNCEKYLATEETHLPFATKDLFEHEEDEDDNEAEDDQDDEGARADQSQEAAELQLLPRVEESPQTIVPKPCGCKDDLKKGSSRMVPFDIECKV
jgi:predicted small integral membrane protein